MTAPVHFIVTDTTGRILKKGICPKSTLHHQCSGSEKVYEQHASTTNGTFCATTCKITYDPINKDKPVSLWVAVKLKRSMLLQSCDWTQVADSPLTATQKAAWATYRQALRDITTQADPSRITWPIAPV